MGNVTKFSEAEINAMQWKLLEDCGDDISISLDQLKSDGFGHPIHWTQVFGNKDESEYLRGVMRFTVHKNHLEIDVVCVLPCDRKKGLGRLMVDSIIRYWSEKLKSELRVVAWIDAENISAQAFFAACGFNQNGFYNGKLRYVKG